MIVDSITAKVQQLRARYEAEGFEVIERPGPEEFPFAVGYHGPYRPALLVSRGDEHHVVEVRDPDRMSTSRLMERMEEIRGHPGWGFSLVSLDDVIPYDAPGTRDEPPAWPQLGQSTHEAVRLASAEASPLALPGLWAALEGVLRRIAVENGIPPASARVVDHGALRRRVDSLRRLPAAEICAGGASPREAWLRCSRGQARAGGP